MAPIRAMDYKDSILSTLPADRSLEGGGAGEPGAPFPMETSKVRYARQSILPEIGQEGQKRLAAARVLCVGAGGLGCPVLLYLTAAGIGHITIIDDDIVDESNLQRQVLFMEADIGQPKALVAKKRLEALNGQVGITACVERLSANRAVAYFERHDLIVDGTDNFPSKYLINDAAVKSGKPVVFAAIQGFEGQVAVFDGARGPCYRCLYPHAPTAIVRNCAEAGVIGAVAGIAGTVQAMQCIALLAAHESFRPLTGRLWRLDALTMEASCLTIPKDPHCPVCSRPPSEIVLHEESLLCETQPVLQTENWDEPGRLRMDVREEDGFRQGRLEGAMNWPLSWMEKGAWPPLPKETPILVYCQKGIRSMAAARFLKGQGFLNVKNLTGGLASVRFSKGGDFPEQLDACVENQQTRAFFDPLSRKTRGTQPRAEHAAPDHERQQRAISPDQRE